LSSPNLKFEKLMNAPRRLSLWKRLIGRRSSEAGSDFGDMGTAFGLDATIAPASDWEIAEAEKVRDRSDSPSTTGHGGNAMDDFERRRDQGAFDGYGEPA
jgi:hypothetical protein